MLLGARQFFAARKAAPAWTNPYVTDGLVAMWDGEWNAGGGVHDPNATVWKDLVGDFDFTLNTAATVNGNYIYCNGSQSAGDTGSLINVSVTTLEIVCQYINSAANTAIFMTGGGSPYYREVFGIALSNMQFVFANQAVFLKDTLLHSWSKNLDDVDCYRDGIDIGINGVGTLDLNSNRGYIGRIGGTGNVGCECRIYSIRLYSRSLTAAEIAANCAIDKARFNLP